VLTDRPVTGLVIQVDLIALLLMFHSRTLIRRPVFV
jgi:hypothetical protein